MKRHEYPENLTGLFILFILHEKPMHGYDLMKELEKRLGRKPSPGTLYPLLNELLEKGYLKVDGLGSRGKKIYGLTEKGERLLDHLIQRLESIIGIALQNKLNVCANCGCQIYSGGVEREIEGTRLIFCCVHCAANYLKETHRHEHEVAGKS